MGQYKPLGQLLVEAMALAFLGITFFPWLWTSWMFPEWKHPRSPATEAPPPARTPTPREFTPQWPLQNEPELPKAEPSKPWLISC
jgi:hypothetical protein